MQELIKKIEQGVIAQLVFVEKERIRLEKVDEFEKKSGRGDGGFGSTRRF